jgi:tRNA1Val (adenine37-N6)-methyltransferase
MPNNYFQFKQFTIYQDGSAMKVGTDGVLLGAWVDVENAQRILDVGTGTGLIAIMMAQRSKQLVQVDAVEIDHSSYEQANKNFEASKWSNQLHAIHSPFQEFCENTDKKYDRIVSNPPYFVNSMKAKGEARTQARHTDCLPFEELLQGSKKLLNSEGTLSVVLPVNEGEYFEQQARFLGFYLKRKIEVLPNPSKAPKRYLLEFSLEECKPYCGNLTIENGQRHLYTEEYKSLTKDFYLKF